MRKAAEQAKADLNPYEERRVRRRFRSEQTGGGATHDPQTQDHWRHTSADVRKQLDDAVRFFSDTMRVPATLIASAAISTLFLPPWAFDGEREPSRMFLFLWRCFMLFTTSTFCFELTAVLVTSNVHAQLLELGRAGVSPEPTAIDFIMSHVEFEYLTCLLSFLGGLMAFMLATLCRITAVFRCSRTLEAPRELRLSLAVSGFIVASLLWWLHLTNVRLVEFRNVGQMLWRFLVLLWARLWLKKVGALGGAAVATFVGSVLVAASALCEARPPERKILAKKKTTRTPCA